MNISGQPLTEDAGELSPWWVRGMLIVMILGFAGLTRICMPACRNAAGRYH